MDEVEGRFIRVWGGWVCGGVWTATNVLNDGCGFVAAAAC